MKKIKKFYCIGDSITYGARNEYFRNYVHELNHIFKDKNIIFENNSVNGETTSEIMKRYFHIVNTQELNGVIFLGGTNDTKVPIPLNIFKKNIETLIAVSKKMNIQLIIGLIPRIFTGLPNYSKNLGNEYVKKYNLIIKNLCKENKINMFDLSKLKELYFPDGIHTNNEGCEKIANLVKSEIYKCL